MFEYNNILVTLILSELFAIFFYCLVWFFKNQKITLLSGYIAYGVLVGFLSFIINLLLISKYEIHYFFQILIVIAISGYMMESSLIGNILHDKKTNK